MFKSAKTHTFDSVFYVKPINSTPKTNINKSPYLKKTNSTKYPKKNFTKETKESTSTRWNGYHITSRRD